MLHMHMHMRMPDSTFYIFDVFRLLLVYNSSINSNNMGGKLSFATNQHYMGERSIGTTQHVQKRSIGAH